MKRFTYVVRDREGIHARNAIQFVHEAEQLPCSVWLEGRGAKTSAKDVMGLMKLAVRFGDEITVTVEGAEEESAARRLEELAAKIF